MELFKKLNILPFHSKYTFSLLIFVIDNSSIFKAHSELYEINNRNKNNFHPSQPGLSIYRNGVYYIGIKAFNHLKLRGLSPRANYTDQGTAACR
jgi:hypothetical protein